MERRLAEGARVAFSIAPGHLGNGCGFVLSRRSLAAIICSGPQPAVDFRKRDQGRDVLERPQHQGPWTSGAWPN